jgi:cell wall-associated NlpC family hydrolase
MSGLFKRFRKIWRGLFRLNGFLRQQVLTVYLLLVSLTTLLGFVFTPVERVAHANLLVCVLSAVLLWGVRVRALFGVTGHTLTARTVLLTVYTAAQTGGQRSVWSDLGFKGRATSRTTQAQRDKDVAFARSQVLARKPYVWGDEGPNAFDCSGLVYAAYRSAGLGWPNWDRLNSSLYAGYTMHVPLSELVPGDLLFYSYKGTISSIHHISIYAGDGMMWEANSKGKGLLYSNIYSIKGLMPFGGRV